MKMQNSLYTYFNRPLLLLGGIIFVLSVCSCSQPVADAPIQQLKQQLNQNDTIALKETFSSIAIQYQQLVKENPQQAEELFSQVQEFVRDNGQQLKSFADGDPLFTFSLAAFSSLLPDQAAQWMEKFKTVVAAAAEQQSVAADSAAHTAP